MSDSLDQKEKISLRVTGEAGSALGEDGGADSTGNGSALNDSIIYDSPVNDAAVAGFGPEASAADSAGESSSLLLSAPFSKTHTPPDGVPDFGGRFQVLEEIGEGGMGVVYKVFDPALDKVFAVKVLKSVLASDKQALKRFAREAEAAISLNHPGLVSVYEHGVTADGTPFLIMDFIDGENLADTLAKDGKIEISRTVHLFTQVIEALQHVHAAGLVHRDIKPRNIILYKTETGEESIKLVDFGIAKEAGQVGATTFGVTQTGEFLGSPLYMSPEQCHGAELNHRSDIYSAGCVLYEMLTGATPFASNNPVKIVVGHLNEKPTAPSSLMLEKSARAQALDGITLQCLEKNPDYRYHSAAALLHDLKLVENEQNPFRERAKQSRKMLFAYGGLMAMMLCLVVGASFIPFDTGGLTGAIRPFAVPLFIASVISFLALSKFMALMRSRGKQPQSQFATMAPWVVSYFAMIGTYVMLPKVPDEPVAVITYVGAFILSLLGLFGVFFRYMAAPKESFLAPLEHAGVRAPTAEENRLLRLFRTFILLTAACMALYCKAPPTLWLSNILPFVGPSLFLMATGGISFSIARKFKRRKEDVKPGDRWLLLACGSFFLYIVSDLVQVYLDILKNNFLIALPQYTPLYSAVVSLEFVSMILTVAFLMAFLSRRSSVSPFGKSDGW